MADVIITPNMGLSNPVPTLDPGPDWATNLFNSLNTLDSHNHSAGSGVQVTPSGININSDLTFNNTNNAINMRSLRFFPQLTPIAASSPDLGCLYESGVDLYYNDGAGNQIRITQSGAVAGASGTITGLPSGTASAAYVSVSGTFVFQQATATAANLDIGSIAIRYPGSYPTPSGNYIQLQAPSGVGAYAITLPATTPVSSGAMLTEDTSGNVSYTNVDNSTLEISSSVIQVKDSGITRPKQSAVGQQVSASCGSYPLSTSFTSVTNLSVTITTTGRPVIISIQPDTTSSPAFISVANGNTSPAVVFYNVLRGATIIAANQVQMNLSTGTGDVFCWSVSTVVVDPVAAGTYTYTVQARIGVNASAGSFANAQLVAYEL